MPRMLTSWFLTMACASVLAFVLYAFDKRAAIRNERRVPEKTLHMVSLLGGWPGAWLAQRVFRHKTSKPTFLWVFGLTVALNVAATTAVLWLNAG
jgi:uncharacterized membrane protein YsdA (DUF1294 family)